MAFLTEIQAQKIAMKQYPSYSRFAYITTVSNNIHIGRFHHSLMRDDGIDLVDIVDIGLLREGDNAPIIPEITVEGGSADVAAPVKTSITVMILRGMLQTVTPPILVTAH